MLSGAHLLPESSNLTSHVADHWTQDVQVIKHAEHTMYIKLLLIANTITNTRRDGNISDIICDQLPNKPIATLI